jgi:hypothetical protein
MTNFVHDLLRRGGNELKKHYLIKKHVFTKKLYKNENHKHHQSRLWGHKRRRLVVGGVPTAHF